MNTVKKIAGYSWGAAAFLIVLVMFPSLKPLEEPFVRATGLTVSPRMLGGEVRQTIDRGTYAVRVHRPVFDGLISERENGFVQIRVVRKGVVPAVIKETVDYKGDGTGMLDFSVDTKTSAITIGRSSPLVKGIETVFHVSDGWAFRVGLKRR